MREYDLTYLLDSSFEGNQLKQKKEEILSLIKELNGEIVEEKELEKRKLGYEIQQRKEALMGIVIFNMEQKKIKEFEQRMKKIEGVLRFLLMKKKRRKEKTQKPKTKIVPAEGKPAKEKKVDLSQIDQKLEEILGEDES